MENNNIESLLEWSINFGDLNQVRMYLSGVMQSNINVTVEQAGKCYFEGDEGLYKHSDLYFCQNSHTFCVPCLQNFFYESFLSYGDAFDYYCPACENVLLYTPQYKSTFINIVFEGIINSMSIQNSFNYPNIFVNPNYELPNYVQPNYVLPNYVQPNYVQPNYVQPNYGQLYEQPNYEIPKLANYILVDTNSDEFHKVSGNFYTTVKNANIKNIYQVNNPALEERFQAKKLEFFISELFCTEYVWHGTSSLETYKKICTEGFLIGGKDVKAKNGSAFGNGVNTSPDASVCINYCGKSNHILLSEAVTGRETQNAGDEDPRFNTYRGNNVILFFDPSQVMPRYLVEFLK